jgi:hypothetical protein
MQLQQIAKPLALAISAEWKDALPPARAPAAPGRWKPALQLAPSGKMRCHPMKRAFDLQLTPSR